MGLCLKGGVEWGPMNEQVDLVYCVFLDKVVAMPNFKFNLWVKWWEEEEKKLVINLNVLNLITKMTR